MTAWRFELPFSSIHQSEYLAVNAQVSISYSYKSRVLGFDRSNPCVTLEEVIRGFFAIGEPSLTEFSSTQEKVCPK